MYKSILVTKNASIIEDMKTGQQPGQKLLWATGQGKNNEVIETYLG